MEIILVLVLASITIFSAILVGLTSISYQKYKNRKLVLICGAFLSLLLKGLILTYSFFTNQFTTTVSNPLIWIFDLVVLLLFYLGYSSTR